MPLLITNRFHIELADKCVTYIPCPSVQVLICLPQFLLHDANQMSDSQSSFKQVLFLVFLNVYVIMNFF